MGPLTSNTIDQLLAILFHQKNGRDSSSEVSWLRTQAPKSKSQVQILCHGENCLDFLFINRGLLLYKIWVIVVLNIK